MADTKFTTGKGRFSYPHVFEPYSSAEGQAAKYSTTFLIPKEDKETLKKLGDACKAVYEEHKNTTFKGILYEEVAKPYHDGDGRKPKGGEYGEECKGHWVLSTSSKRKPLIIDRMRTNVTDETAVYPGCYGRIAVNLYAYNVSGNRGIACGLNGVQTFQYGEVFGGGASAEDFNDGFEDPDEDGDDLGL